jgi:protein-tyrosine phosphatase
MQRQLSFPTCYNVRDLGGLATANGATTRWKSFVRADSLYRLTPESQRAFFDYGIRTVIDLRSDVELAEQPNPFRDGSYANVTYTNIPMIDPRNAERISAIVRDEGMLAWNLLMLDLSSGQIVQIMRTVAHAPEGGIAFHCYAGKDRTGLTAMLLLSLAGVSDHDIAEDYEESNRYLDELNQAVLARFGDPNDPVRQQRVMDNMMSGRDNMRKIIAHVRERHGDAEQYLRHIGLTGAEIARIRSRLI